MSIDIIFVFYWIVHSYHFFICKSRLRGAWYWEQDADEIRQGCIKADIEQGCNYRLPPYLPPKHKQFGEHQQEGHRRKYNGIDAFVVVNIWHVRMGYWTPRDNKCPAKSSTLCNTWHLYDYQRQNYRNLSYYWRLPSIIWQAGIQYEFFLPCPVSADMPRPIARPINLGPIARVKV